MVEVLVEADFNPSSTAPGYIHWVSEPSPGVEPLKVELRLYDVLFKSADPSGVENWMDDLNPDSLKVFTGCYADPILKTAPVGSRFQFERVGYFCIDPDTTLDNIVCNRIVLLKEAKWEESN